jgi:hypothetical protein
MANDKKIVTKKFKVNKDLPEKIRLKIDDKIELKRLVRNGDFDELKKRGIALDKR